MATITPEELLEANLAVVPLVELSNIISALIALYEKLGVAGQRDPADSLEARDIALALMGSHPKYTQAFGANPPS